MLDDTDTGFTPISGWDALIVVTLLTIALIALMVHRRRDRTRQGEAAERECRDLESRYCALYDRAPLGIALIGSLTGRIHDANPRFAAITGRSREELATIDWMQITHPDDVQEDLDQMARLNAGEITGFEMSKRYLRPDGSPVWINMTIAPLGLQIWGGPSHICMIEDITEHEAAQARTVASDARYRLLFETSPFGIVYQDPTGAIIGANPAAQRILGRSEHELKQADSLDPRWQAIKEDGTPFPGSTHPAMRVLATGRAVGGAAMGIFNPRLQRHVWIRVDAVPLATPDTPGGFGVYTIFEDISQQRAAEQKRAESEARFRDVAEISGDWIWEVDANTRFTYASAGVRDGLGYEIEELIGRKPFDLMPPEEATRVAAEFGPIAAGGRPFRDLENVVLHKDGTPHTLLTSGIPLVDAQGKLRGYRGMDRDITTQKRDQRALWLSRVALDSASDAVYWVDPDGSIFDVNQSACRMLGYRRDQLIAMQVADLDTAYPTDGRAWQRLWEALRQEHCILLETTHRANDGRIIPVEVSINLILHEGREYTCAIVRDLSARKAAEQELSRALNRYTKMLSASSDGFWLVDAATGRLIDANEAAARMSGYTRAELLTMKITDLDVLHSEADFHLHTARIMELGGELFETQHRTKDGRMIDVEVSVTSDPETNTVVSFLRDITDRKRAEAELRRSEETLQRAQAVGHVGSWWLDIPSGRLRWSAETYRIFGVAPTQPPDLEKFMACVHPDDRSMVRDAWQAALAGAPYDIQHRIVVTGETRWVRERGAIERGGDQGDTLTGVGTVQDITELKLAEQELEQNRHHLEDLVHERTAELEQANRQLRRNDQRLGAMFALSQEAGTLTEQELLRRGIDEAVRLTNSEIGYVHFVNDDQESIRLSTWSTQTVRQCKAVFDDHYPVSRAGIWADSVRFRRAVIHNDYQRLEQPRGYPEGHVHLIRHLGVPVIEHGKASLLLGVGNKPSDYDDVDAGELQRIGEDLWRIFSRRRAELMLAEAKEAAEAAARVKGEFLANMSHEIRTPLNGVLGLAQVGYRDGEMPTRARESFARILESGKTLLALVNDILDFSKIEAGKLPIEQIPVDIRALIGDVAEGFGERAEAKGLGFSVTRAPDLPLYCLGDPVRLSQILLNLVGNAVKFTERGRVELWAGREGPHLIFRVEDTGIGLSTEQRERLFAPFEQGDTSTTRKFGGTGLGLAITRRLVDLMGGQILIESSPGKGSVFEVQLPYREVTDGVSVSGECAPDNRGGPRLAGLRILVAEDNEINGLVIDEMLRAEGARLTIVENGRLAVDAVANGGAWDLALLDVQMPEMDGLEACRRILELVPDLPVIGQTAHALSEEHAKCRDAGMVDVVTKPIDPDRLVQTVLRHLPLPGGLKAQQNSAEASGSRDDLASTAPASGDLIDWQGLAAVYRGKESFIDRLIGIAIRSLQPVPERLRAAALANNLAEIGSTAHRLKGSLGSLMAAESAALATRTQHAARSGSPEAAALSTELAEQVDAILEALARHKGVRTESTRSE
jgi:PAS domain S-box-containing protein